MNQAELTNIFTCLNTASLIAYAGYWLGGKEWCGYVGTGLVVSAWVLLGVNRFCPI